MATKKVAKKAVTKSAPKKAVKKAPVKKTVAPTPAYDNNLYNLMTQLVQEQKSLWRRDSF